MCLVTTVFVLIHKVCEDPYVMEQAILEMFYVLHSNPILRTMKEWLVAEVLLTGIVIFRANLGEG